MLNKLKDLVFWYKNYKKYFAFVNKNNFHHNKNDHDVIDFTIIIEPWKMTPLPWYAITIGLLLQQKGHNVKILLNDLKFEDSIRFNAQIFFIKKVLKVLKKYLRVEVLTSTISDKEYFVDNKTENELYKLAFANAVHRNRGEVQGGPFNKEVKENYKKFLKNVATIEAFMRLNSQQYFIIPGGIYSFTGLFLKFAKENNSKFFVYDSGFGVMLTSISGVAAHCKDTAIVAKEILKQNNPVVIKKAINIANEELEKRINGTNSFKTQYQDFKNSIKVQNVGFLIPLNSPWDSAALNIDTVFSSYREWLVETVRIILTNTNENVTVRQHPDERHWYGKGNLNFGEILQKEFNGSKRIQYISCNDMINTYAVLNDCKAVICFSSTFGVEAALYCKPVITCSSVYYSDFSFVEKATSKEHLIELIVKSLKLNLTAEQVNEAAVVFYLGQRCNWLYTAFTPTPDDFSKWNKLTIHEVSQLEGVNMYIKSIITHTPIPSLKNQEIQKNN